MPRTLTKEEIFGLTIDERLQLIESVWDSLSPGDIPVPDSHRQALDDAIADREGNPNDEQPWSSVRKDILGRK